MTHIKMPVLGYPNPLQPEDTQDKIARISADTRYDPLCIVDRIEFECSLCHKTYWRDVLHEGMWTEEVTVEGVMAPSGKPARYALNPTMRDYYAPNTHQCSDASSI